MPLNKPDLRDLKPSANSVLHRAQNIPDKTNHTLYFDRWVANFDNILPEEGYVVLVQYFQTAGGETR